MLRKIGLVTAALAAGAFSAGGVAAADSYPTDDSVGLLNLGGTEALHNVDGAVGFCDNTFNILIVQVPLHDVANTGESPRDCAADTHADGGLGR
ncbi:hypothetical protein [Amycolatopsis sp. CA-128772]|uniref:hypothetical protein n=1 Tax=Amycolatopsis sp. CA-128772 TaxID=2073159 RepID=UPI000CD2FBCE|nr:hypothetical protein [Amycolatopsis sp. CA-128772]